MGQFLRAEIQREVQRRPELVERYGNVVPKQLQLTLVTEIKKHEKRIWTMENGKTLLFYGIGKEHSECHIDYKIELKVLITIQVTVARMRNRKPCQCQPGILATALLRKRELGEGDGDYPN